jgi:hypothetical protein
MSRLWVISGHGGVATNAKGNIQLVPLNGIHFYTCSKEQLVSKPTMTNHNALMRGATPKTGLDRYLKMQKMDPFNGVSIPDYEVTFTDDQIPANGWLNDVFGQSCVGIFLIGKSNGVGLQRWSPGPGNGLKLSEFFKNGCPSISTIPMSGDYIAWECCRVWMSSQKGGFIKTDFSSGKATTSGIAPGE